MNDQNETRVEPDLSQDLKELQQELLAEDVSNADLVVGIEWPPAPRTAVIGPRAHALLEALMSSHLPAPAEARSRLVSAVDGRLEYRRIRSGFLEPLLKSSRIAASRTQEEVAKAIDVTVDQLRDLENGLPEFRDEDVDLLAQWIKELEEDTGDAVAALARSFDAAESLSSGAYAGRGDVPSVSGAEYAEKVRARIAQLRQAQR